MLKKFGAYIFDLDGVIVDTVPIHFEAWKRMFNEHGKEFTFEDYKEKVDGIPRYDGARNILTDVSDEELKKAADYKQELFKAIIENEGIPEYESTVGLIKKLDDENIPKAVISSSKNCTYILKKIGIYDLMDAVIDGNWGIKNGKPDPEIFITAAREIGVKPEECIVFEDAILGVEAAKAAGMYCVGIDRYGAPERLAIADIVIKDISEFSI